MYKKYHKVRVFSKLFTYHNETKKYRARGISLTICPKAFKVCEINRILDSAQKCSKASEVKSLNKQRV